MAQIPLGNFGNVMPQTQPGRVLDTGAGYIARAVSQLGEVGQQLSVKKLEEQQKIQDEKDEYFFNIQAAKFGSEYQDSVTDTKQRLATGEFDEATAKANLRKQSDRLNENYRQTLPEAKHEKFNYYSEKMYLDSEVNVKPLAYEVERKKINSDFEQVIEATLKLENREQGFALFKSTLEKNPVLTPEQRVQQEQDWQQRKDLSDGKGVLNNLENASDIEGLQKVYDGVTTMFPHMKIETQDAYKGQIESAISRINRAKEVEQTRLDAEYKQLASDFRTDAYTGYPISAERVNAVLAKVKGTEYEAQVKEDLALNKDAQKFRTKSPIEQEREISRLTSSLENTPQVDGSLLQKQLSMYQGIANTSKQRATNDPIAQIQSQTGKQLYTVNPEQIGTGQVDFKQAQITTELLVEQKKKNGSGSLIQWNKTERQAFIDSYATATTTKQRAILTDLTKMVGGNKEAQLEYFKLISNNNPYDYVGVAKLNQMDVVLHGTNVRVADVVLEGKQLMRTGEDKLLGQQKEFETQIASEFGNATTKGQLEYRTYANMAYSAYIGLAKRYPAKIQVDDKGKPFINKKLAKQAFDITSGGTYKQKFGKNTNTVFMPYGYSQESFQDHLDEHFRTTFRKETDTVTDLRVLNDYAIRRKSGFSHLFEFVSPEGRVFKNPKTGKDYFVAIPPKQSK